MTVIPDSPAPILGYRVWGVTADRLLRSTTSGFVSSSPVWEPFEAFTARCLALSPCAAGCPSVDHGCGVHAYRELEAAAKWARAVPWEKAVVIGRVQLWGRVVEAARGWRAEYAYPESFVAVVTRNRRSLDRSCVDELTRRYATVPAPASAV